MGNVRDKMEMRLQGLQIEPLERATGQARWVEAETARLVRRVWRGKLLTCVPVVVWMAALGQTGGFLGGGDWNPVALLILVLASILALWGVRWTVRQDALLPSAWECWREIKRVVPGQAAEVEARLLGEKANKARTKS